MPDQRMADWRANAPQSVVLWMRAKARPLFRRSIALPFRKGRSGASRTRDELRLPCRRIAQRPKGATDFYSSATPRVQLLKHPLTSGHRGTTPAATLLPGLVMVYVSRHPIRGASVGHVARGSDPQLTKVCLERLFEHSFREERLVGRHPHDFGEPN